MLAVAEAEMSVRYGLAYTVKWEEASMPETWRFVSGRDAEKLHRPMTCAIVDVRVKN